MHATGILAVFQEMPHRTRQRARWVHYSRPYYAPLSVCQRWQVIPCRTECRDSPENSFWRDLICAWTSMPMTTSQPGQRGSCCVDSRLWRHKCFGRILGYAAHRCNMNACRHGWMRRRRRKSLEDRKHRSLRAFFASANNVLRSPHRLL